MPQPLQGRGLRRRRSGRRRSPITGHRIRKSVDSKEKILNTFNGFVGEFMERSPFFRVWREGAVDRTMADSFLTTFDSLVKSFPALIAAGVARAQDEETRTTLAVNLFQECGE